MNEYAKSQPDEKEAAAMLHDICKLIDTKNAIGLHDDVRAILKSVVKDTLRTCITPQSDDTIGLHLSGI
jgi:hypothetical protein